MPHICKVDVSRQMILGPLALHNLQHVLLELKKGRAGDQIARVKIILSLQRNFQRVALNAKFLLQPFIADFKQRT